MFHKRINQWFDYIECRFSFNTVKLYKQSLQFFSQTLPPDIKTVEIKSLNIQEFITSLRKKGLTPKSCNSYMSGVWSFFRWFSVNYSEENPASQIKKLHENPPNLRILTDQEYKLILRSTYHPDKTIIQFLANTGLRKSEFFSITPSCFAFDLSYINIHGKGDKFRLVPLNAVCKNIAQRYLLRIGSPAQFFKPKRIYRRFESIAKHIDIKPFTPHCFRHYFATRLLRKGVPIIIVSKILGHANVLITQNIYCHLCLDDIRVTDRLEF